MKNAAHVFSLPSQDLFLVSNQLLMQLAPGFLYVKPSWLSQKAHYVYFALVVTTAFRQEFVLAKPSVWKNPRSVAIVGHTVIFINDLKVSNL
jgi:hypothetical protein